MDLRHLRYFLAVSEEAHFGRAAERLHIVQPALSMQIKALEAELGGPLFIRTSRRVELTEAGKLLLTEAKRTLEQVDHTRQVVARALRGETGRVRVGFAGNAVFSGQLIADLRHFHQRYPDAELVIEEVAAQRQAEAILSGHLDIGYAPDNSNLMHPELQTQPLGRWDMLVALPDEHPLAANAHLSLDMLAGEPLILYEAHDVHERLYMLLSQKLGDRLHVAHRSASTLSVLAHAATGLGLALIPTPLQQIQLPGMCYCQLNEPELFANLVLIHRTQESNQAVNAFIAAAHHPAP